MLGETKISGFTLRPLQFSPTKAPKILPTAALTEAFIAKNSFPLRLETRKAKQNNEPNSLFHC